MEFLGKLDLKVIAAWLQLLVLVFGVVAALRSKWRDEVQAGQKDRWQFIRESVPEVHGVVQKIAAMTRTQKDDAFVAMIGKLLRAAGMLPVQPDEIEAVKALGSGYHQEFKIMRDPAVELIADPPEGSSEPA